MAGVTENGASRARNHIANVNAGQNGGLFLGGKDNAISRKKCTVTLSTAQRISPASHGVPVRTAAQRILRSLNSLGVVVADSVPAVSDIEATHSPESRPEAFERLR